MKTRHVFLFLVVLFMVACAPKDEYDESEALVLPNLEQMNSNENLQVENFDVDIYEKQIGIKRC